MSKIVLVTDSTCGIPADLVKKYDIKVAPQILVWSNKTYRDGVDIQTDEFYRRLKTDSAMPTTSQATIGEFKNIYTQSVEEGNQALTVVLSNKLSGTMDSALQARDLLPGAKIEIVDSHMVAMALGFLVLHAAVWFPITARGAYYYLRQPLRWGKDLEKIRQESTPENTSKEPG